MHDLRLSAGDERLSRVAFVAVPADTLVVSLAIGDRPAAVWSGVQLRAGELITFGPGQWVHARTDGSSRWGAIRLPQGELTQYGRALTGAEFVIPPAARWRPRRAPLRELRHLHQAAVRRVEARSDVIADNETAHGLEQQVIHASSSACRRARSTRKWRAPAGVAVFSPGSRICSRPSPFPALPKSARRSASRIRRCTSVATSI
jgi:hypothetical protein